MDKPPEADEKQKEIRKSNGRMQDDTMIFGFFIFWIRN